MNGEEPHAYARRGDPDTSWEAAHSLDPEHLRASQAQVLATLQDHGPMTDAALELMLAGEQAPSGVRTRRRELADMGLVYDTEKREVLASGRHAIVWAARWHEPRPVQPTLW